MLCDSPEEKQLKQPQQCLYKYIGEETYWRLEYSFATCASQAEHVWSSKHRTSPASKQVNYAVSSLREQRESNERHTGVETAGYSPGFVLLKLTLVYKHYERA